MNCIKTLTAVACSLLITTNLSRAADDTIVLSRDFDSQGFLKPIPISISGFSPEVEGILTFDLLFMGFTNVPPDQAKYLISGGNSGRVEGRVMERINRHQLLARAYTGGTQRSQVHAFADDIANTLTRLPGIAKTKVAFRVETGRGVSEIYISDYDGHNAQPVTRDRSLTVAPEWSGKNMLYYTSYKLGSPQIFSQHLTTGARQAVTHYSGSNISPAVSPNGRRLAMILSKGGSPDLWVSDADGRNLMRLTSTKAEESSPCWGPDNQTICYVSKSSGVNALYRISANGGGPVRIKTAGVPNATEPAWSPDGKWIAFTALMRDFNICLVEAGGGNAMVLATGEDPSWAANSRALIFCKGPDHAKRLSLLDVPTKQVKDIARILESNSQPSWAQ